MDNVDIHVQLNPVNMVTNGPQKSDRAKGVIFMNDDNFYKNNNTFD